MNYKTISAFTNSPQTIDVKVYFTIKWLISLISRSIAAWAAVLVSEN